MSESDKLFEELGYEKRGIRMDIEEDIKIVKEFNEKNRFRDCGRLNNAINHVLAEREKDKEKIERLEEENRIQRHQIVTVYDNGYVHKNKIKEDYIPKQKVKEELEEAEKENEPYEQHNKESRIYWINKGKISLAKKIWEDK